MARLKVDSIRNRNLFMEGLAGEGAVPTKYDMLTGRPIKIGTFQLVCLMLLVHSILA